MCVCVCVCVCAVITLELARHVSSLTECDHLSFSTFSLHICYTYHVRILVDEYLILFLSGCGNMCCTSCTFGADEGCTMQFCSIFACR